MIKNQEKGGACVTDTKALEKAVASSGVMKKHICERLGLTFQGLAEKMKGRSEFKASEILAFQEALHLSNEERDRIFFAPDSD